MCVSVSKCRHEYIPGQRCPVQRVQYLRVRSVAVYPWENRCMGPGLYGSGYRVRSVATRTRTRAHPYPCSFLATALF